MEELKKLVRYWKLHEARGFWKTHPTKEDLVSALLEYMEDKDYARKPSRPPSSKPSKDVVRIKSRRHSQTDIANFKVQGFKPYNGDLFSQRDYTDGILYLSRQSIRNLNTPTKTQQQAPNQRKKRNTFLSSEFLGVMGMTENAPENAIATEEQVAIAERQRMQWRAIIVEIFKYSREPGDELEILDEGALRVIDKINHCEQVTTSLANFEMAIYCAATLLNLACSPPCREQLLPPRQNVLVEAFNAITAHHSSEHSAMLLCVMTLGYLSVPFGGEDALVATSLTTLGAAASVDSKTCRKAAIATLANLFVASERNQMIEHILPTIKALAALNEVDSALLVLSTIYNMSFYDTPRVTLIEASVVVLLGTLMATINQEVNHLPEPQQLSYQDDSQAGTPLVDSNATQSTSSIEFDGHAAFHMLAECVLNLSCSVDGRERMIKDGASSLLVDLEHVCVFRSTREVIGLAFSNLTASEVVEFLPIVVASGAVRSLVNLAEAVEGLEASNRIAQAICNLSSDTDNRELMVEQGSHLGLIKLSNAAAPTSPCQPLILVAFINLLSVSANQRAIIDSGLLPMLERVLTEDPSEEVKQYCGMALANVADDLSLHKKDTREIVIAMMTRLASSTNPGLLRIIASAFAMFAYIITAHDETNSRKEKHQAQISDDVVRTILRLCSSTDTVVLKFGGITLNNLSQETGLHKALLRNDVASALFKLAASRDEEVRRVCACTVHALTSSGELIGFETECVKGIVDVLSTLENCRAADVINFCASSLFFISCMPKHMKILSTESAILRRLFGMMRGGQESTQLCAARALCNLTCDKSCVETLLRERTIADFIAIAILRTNNEEVKGVCAECLFNLVRYDTTRPQLLCEPNNVLWAISRLFRYCVESERTQRIGALVVYNLSCNEDTAKTLLKTINVSEMLAAVAMHVETDSKLWAAAALCNMSWTPEFASQLVLDAPVNRSQSEIGYCGIVRVFRTLADADLPEHVEATVKLQTAIALYNMSQGSEEVCERLIDDGVTVFIELLLADTDEHLVELACVACYNISNVPGCEAAMVDYQVAGSLLKLIRQHIPSLQEDTERPRFPTGRASKILLALGTLYNFSVKLECRSSLEAAGVSDACIAVAQLESTPKEHRELVTSILHNLSLEAENHRQIVSKGYAMVQALSYLTSQPDATLSQISDIANIICNLSCTSSLAGQLSDVGVVDLLALIVAKASPGEEDVLNICATTARNASHYPKSQNFHQPCWHKPDIEFMMQRLAKLPPDSLTEDQHTRLEDVAACLYNILIVGGSQLGCAENLSSILAALFKRSQKPETRSLCAAALIARQGDKDSTHYSDGSVNALHSAMQAEIAAYDADSIATPKTLKQDKRDQRPGMSKEMLGSRFSLFRPNKSTICSNEVTRSSTDPEWKSFTQDANVVTQGLEPPVSQAVKLPKQPAYPPRYTYTKTSGKVRKVLFLPNKAVPTVNNDNSSLATQGEGDDESEAFDHPMRISLRFDFEEMFLPLYL